MALIGVLRAQTPVLARQDLSDDLIEAPRVDASHAMRAHRQVEAWLKQGRVNLGGSQPIRVTGLIGVRLTLRSQGFVIGQGQAYRPDPAVALDAPGPGVDVMPLLAQATEQAIAGVRESLADLALRQKLQGQAVQGLRELTVGEVSPRLLVDLELGYGLKAIHVPTGAGPDEVYARFAPGYHGLGFQGAEPGEWAWVWPGEAITRNIAPSSQLALGLKRLGYERSQRLGLARPNGVGLARFRAFQITRPVLDMQPALLIRGKSDLPRYPVDERTLESMGDRMLEHLVSRFIADDRVRGTYLPTSGRYDPTFAPDDQVALACYAITHHCRYLSAVRPKDQSVIAFSERSLRVATGLGRGLLEAQGRASPQTVALVLLTLLETPLADSDKALRDRLGDWLVSLALPKQEQGGAGGAGHARMNAATEALVASALATLYEQTREAELGEAVWSGLDRIWNEGQTPDLAAMPWLALANERACRVLAGLDETGARQAELDRRRLISAGLIDRLCQRQVIERPQLGPQDVLGGFVLSPGPTGSPPNPDWRTAQPLIFLSAALRDRGVTQGRDKLGWLLAAGYSARFIGQLMMDEPSCYYVRDPHAAMGGVRMALWDNRLAIAPTAMSLMAVTELQITLASVRQDINAPKPTHE